MASVLQQIAKQIRGYVSWDVATGIPLTWHAMQAQAAYGDDQTDIFGLQPHPVYTLAIFLN